MTAEDFLAATDAPPATATARPSAEEFLTDAPSAEDFLSDRPGAIGGTVNEFQRGLLAGQQQLVAGELAATPKRPSLLAQRRLFVRGMSDPRYWEALNQAGDDPIQLQRVEAFLGPQAQLNRVQEQLDLRRQFLSEDVAQLETEAQAIPQSEALAEWGKADNSNWWKVLARNPVEITAGIMAQSLPAMAPALAANLVAPGGAAGRTLASGAGSFSTEAANAFLDSARQTGYDLTDPDKVREFFDNPDAQTKARQFAAQRGLPIAVFDALTAGLAGKFVKPALKQGTARVLVGTGKEVALQAAGGAAGEAAAQVSSGQPLSAKDIVAEALGEIASGPSEVLSSLREKKAAAADGGASVPASRPPNDELPPPTRVAPPPTPLSPTPETTPAPIIEATAAPAAQPAQAASQPGAVEIIPVPEAGDTLQLQMDMLRNGRRSVVLITPGETMPEVPGNMKAVTVPDVGTFIYSPRVHREENLVAQAKAGKLGRILGYGIDTKPKPGTEVGAVTVRTPDGTEKQAVVTDAAHLPAVTQAAEKIAAPGDTVQLEPPEQVIADRVAGGASVPASRVPVTDRHLAEARQILSETERPPDVLDELEGRGTTGPVQFPAADYGTLIESARERAAQARHGKEWKQLSSSQRKAINQSLRASTTEGAQADQVLQGLAAENPKYADWSLDDFANALLDAGEGRLSPKVDEGKVRTLAQEIASAEESGSTSRSTPSEQADTQATPDVESDTIENWFNEAIAATELTQRRTLEGVTAAPVWLTKAALNGLLRVIRATYRGTKNLAHALQAGVEWLRAQNLPDFSETDIRQWLERNVTTTPQDHDINLREFTDQLDADQPLPPDPARMVANLLYERRTNESDAAFAARVIAAVGGPAAAVDVFSDATNALPGSVRMLLGQLIIKQLGAAGQHEAAARFYDETFAAHITETAQALQSLSAFLALTPEGKVIWAKRKIERAARDLIAPVEPQLDAAKAELDAANQTGIEATTAAPDVQAAARNAVDAALETQAGKLGTELQQAIRQQVLDDLVKAGLLTAREAEIYRLFLDGAGQGATLQQLLESAGIPHHDQRATAINQLYKARTQAERQKIKSRAQQARKQQLAQGDESAIDAALRKAMKELRVMLGQIIREHHTQADALGKSLAEKIAAASGLSEAEAKKLAEVVQRRFAQLVTARKQKALEKLLKPVRQAGLAKPGLAEKLIAASNLGALSEEQFWNAVRAQLNLPAWNAELAGRIRAQVDALERIPADQLERKQKAQIELLNLVERAKGLDGYDLAMAFYVTNILTGVTTHLKNLGSTFLNVTGTLGTELARSVASGHLDDVPVLLEALGQGMKRGKLAAGDVLRTGVVTGSRLTKLEPGRALELTQFGRRGGVPAKGTLTKAVLEHRLASILNLWKYNFRLMAAEDLLFFKPAEEAKAVLLAKRLARSEGLRGAAATDRARQLMGYGQRAVATARAQATQEGFTGSAHARRTAEILNANRPAQLQEDARQFALRSTFNAQPYGALGFVAGLINQAKVSPNHKIRLGANLIAPFTNIIANVVNESLNYTPIGVVRARWPSDTLLGYAKGKLSLEQQADLRAELQAKALVGTALLAGLALRAAGELDEEDPEFAIYGAGPASAQDRQGLEAKQWIAHSIKVGNRYYSFANTPLAIPLAWLGGIYDRLRDARLFKNRSAQRTAESLPLMAASSAVGMAKVITEQSFMVGLMDLAGTVSEPSPEVGGRGLLKQAVRTGSSFIVPNAVRQVDKFFDPKQYDQRSAEAILVNAIPFVRGVEGQPSLNALGRPILRPLAQQFTSSQADAPALVKYLAETGNWPAMPDRNHIWPRTGRTMTDAEYYAFVKGSGEIAYNQLERLRATGTLARYKAETRAKVIAEYFEAARKQWRSRNGW